MGGSRIWIVPATGRSGAEGGKLAMGSLVIVNIFNTLLVIYSVVKNMLFTIAPALAFCFSVKTTLLPKPMFLLLLTGIPGH